MAYRLSAMSILRSTDYEAFCTKLRKTFVKHRGNLVHAAKGLDVSESAVKRWVGKDAAIKKFLTDLRNKSAA